MTEEEIYSWVQSYREFKKLLESSNDLDPDDVRTLYLAIQLTKNFNDMTKLIQTN